MSQNQQIGKIATQTAFKARSRFNLDHDYNTTLTFGETQPSFIREMIPGSKLDLKANSLVRLAPMPAPTFGRMKIENRSHFIPHSSLVKHFQDSFLTQTIVSEGSKTFKVDTLPHIKLCRLSWYILTGAKCTIYKTRGGDESTRGQLVKGFNLSDPTAKTELDALVSSLSGSAKYFTSGANAPAIGEYGEGYMSIVPERMFNVDDEFTGNLDVSKCTTIPLSAGHGSTFGLNRQSNNLDETGEKDYAYGAVHLNSADFVHTVTRKTGPETIHFAFRLSNFGKRLRKILLGLGYQIDFRATNEVSILPLFAYYKAYFDSFGLTLYQNYLHTNACRCLTDFDFNNNPNYNDPDNTLPRESFRSFIYDLGNTFATAPQDYVSSHTVTTAVSPSAGSALSFIDVQSGDIPIVSPNSSNSHEEHMPTNPHAYINQVIHSHLDSEYLKKLYKWTNKNTIAGKRIREILISQGFGDWVDKQKTFFIGQDEQRIEIMEISATADTLQTGGSSLGEWAGKGRSEKSSKKHSYETDEHGYFITISTLVPEGGYTQAISDHINEINKFDFYNPEFDSMGYDASRFSETVCGTQNWSQHGSDEDDSKSSLTETFGFKPRYLEKKVQANKMNGDFNLRSTRNSYLPYTLDKILDVGERDVEESIRVENNPTFMVKKLFPMTNVPSAGDVWRYYYRYAWLSNFNRIFINGGNVQYIPADTGTLDDANKFVNQEMEATQADNFLLHQFNEVTYHAPMLSISHSYETTDDYGGSSHDMGKA